MNAEAPDGAARRYGRSAAPDGLRITQPADLGGWTAYPFIDLSASSTDRVARPSHAESMGEQGAPSSSTAERIPDYRNTIRGSYGYLRLKENGKL